MYIWRKISDDERKRVLAERKGRKLPWHSPPHIDFEGPATFIINAACFEHVPIIGRSADRMAECERNLLETCGNVGAKLFAWCILPNHYHLLVRTDRISELRKEIGLFHGRSSRFWNQEDQEIGRQTWFNFFDRNMKSARHYWVSLNYIHHNPVEHGYVKKWQDWPFSSARIFLRDFGREKAEYIWRKYQERELSSLF